MDIENLCRTIKNNYHRLKDKKKAFIYLRYQFELLAWKRNKLKLGAIVFEVKRTFFHNTLLLEEIEIRYIRQDNTIADERKLENILKRIGWHWDAKNVIALIVVVIGFATYFYSWIYYQYQRYLPTLAFRSEHYDFILRFGFETGFSENSIQPFKSQFSFNYWLVDVLTDFCVYFNIIF